MKVWVSGARGFVGSALVPRLRGAGHEVVAVDTDVDVVDAAAVDASLAAARPDAVVHLAALASVARSLAEPAAAARVNLLGTFEVLRAVARRAPRARVLLVSSGEIYGEHPLGGSAPPFDESSPLRPGTPYARTKAAADLLGRCFAARGLDVVRVRPFDHVGPGQSDAYALASFARQLVEMAGLRPPELRVGNLDAVRDVLDVEDVVAAYLALLEPGLAPGAYNVASGRGRSLREILAALMARARVEPAVVVDAARWRPGGVAVGCAAKLRDATGWRPRVPFENTLDRVLEHWRGVVSATP